MPRHTIPTCPNASMCSAPSEARRSKLAMPRLKLVKWCLKEKVLLGKWSAIAILELQRIRFAGWALTEGQHRPKTGKKKKTREAGLFFLVPAE